MGIFESTFHVAWENSRHLATLQLVSPPNDVWETSAEIPYWWRVTIKIWVMLLIGRATWEIWFNQSQALPRSWEWRVVSLESLRSFIKHHLEGKPMEASPNVSCFLRPLSMFFFCLFLRLPSLNRAHFGMVWNISSPSTSQQTKSSLTVKIDDVTSGRRNLDLLGWFRGEWVNETGRLTLH